MNVLSKAEQSIAELMDTPARTVTVPLQQSRFATRVEAARALGVSVGGVWVIARDNNTVTYGTSD